MTDEEDTSPPTPEEIAEGEGEPVEMEEEPKATPEAPTEHHVGGVRVTLESIIVSHVPRGFGIIELNCALCNWKQAGTEDVVQIFANYHIDVVHHREYHSLKKQFMRTKAEYQRRLDQSETDRKEALKKAKEEAIKKLDAEDEEAAGDEDEELKRAKAEKLKELEKE